MAPHTLRNPRRDSSEAPGDGDPQSTRMQTVSSKAGKDGNNGAGVGGINPGEAPSAT